MKKLIIIAVLFCLSAMTFKTEAELKKIPDKDFEEFFTNFQKGLKNEKHRSSYFLYDIDWNRFKNIVCNNKYRIDDIFCRDITYFLDVIDDSYNLICNMSLKNKYSVSKKDKSGRYYFWALGYYSDGIVPDESRPEVYINEEGYEVESYDNTSGYGVPIYVLYSGCTPCNTCDYHSGYCVFAKINGYWKIIDVYHYSEG